MKSGSIWSANVFNNQFAVTFMRQIAAIRPKAGYSPFLLILVMGLTVLFTSSCQQVAAEPIETPAIEPAITSAPVELPTEEPAQVVPTLPEPTAIPALPSAVCSPLQGLSLADVTSIKTNSLKLPSPGKDDGHHGIDYSFWTFRGMDTIEGMGINSVLNGLVAGKVDNRFPYGYMVIIETPLELLPPGLRSQLNSIQPQPLQDLSNSPLSCPAISSTDFSSSGRSLYLLYAHMLEDVKINPGDQVVCGETFGQVGNSGDSSNAHLHFEARVGPSGFRFTEMAHYLNDSSDTERFNYCAWRISGVFQLVDPQIIIDAGATNSQ